MQKVLKKGPRINPSHDDKTSPLPKWASISCATDQSSSPQDASMSTYSPTIEVEVEDEDYLPLTSVLMYTNGSN